MEQCEIPIMAIEIVDVLQTNLILIGARLVNTSEELEAFRKDVGTETVTAESGLGGDVIERTHTLSRDRITVGMTSDRTAIIREYPSKTDLERLAQVAEMAFQNTDLEEQELRALGYNIELVYEPDSEDLAIHYLAQRLFVPRLLNDDESRLLGGAGRLYFEKSGLSWQLRLEPRLNDEATKIFASLNLHFTGPSLAFPDKDEVRNSLIMVWNEAHELIDRLDGSSTS